MGQIISGIGILIAFLGFFAGGKPVFIWTAALFIIIGFVLDKILDAFKVNKEFKLPFIFIPIGLGVMGLLIIKITGLGTKFYGPILWSTSALIFYVLVNKFHPPISKEE